MPLAEIRSLAAATYPDVLLPTHFPPKVTIADLGGNCGSLGVGGPPCFAVLEYTTSQGRSAFQLALFEGHVAGKVVAALLRHDGKFGSTRAFSAGRFAGTRERQWNHSFKAGGVDTYVWQSGAKTYALVVRFLDNGAQAFPGADPPAIVASFSSVKGAKPATIFSAPSTTTMPDLFGMTQEQAVAAAKKAGIDTKLRIGQMRAGTPSEVGRVARTVPRAGNPVSPGDVVTVYIGY